MPKLILILILTLILTLILSVYDPSFKRESLYDPTCSQNQYAKGYIIMMFEFASSSSTSSSLSKLQDKSIQIWKDVMGNPSSFNYVDNPDTIDHNNMFKSLHISFGSTRYHYHYHYYNYYIIIIIIIIISLPSNISKEILQLEEDFEFRITDSAGYSNRLSVIGNVQNDCTVSLLAFDHEMKIRDHNNMSIALQISMWRYY